MESVIPFSQFSSNVQSYILGVLQPCYSNYYNMVKNPFIWHVLLNQF